MNSSQIKLNRRNLAVAFARLAWALMLFFIVKSCVESIVAVNRPVANDSVLNFQLTKGHVVDFSEGDYVLLIESDNPFRFLLDNKLVQSVQVTEANKIPISWEKKSYYVPGEFDNRVFQGKLEIIDGALRVKILNKSNSAVMHVFPFETTVIAMLSLGLMSLVVFTAFTYMMRSIGVFKPLERT